MICVKNKKNTKNIDKLNKLKISIYDKMLLNRISKIEHLNNMLKKYKTINIRYDKYSINFENYILLALILISFNKIGYIDNYM
jgi:hypothetical protein